MVHALEKFLSVDDEFLDAREASGSGQCALAAVITRIAALLARIAAVVLTGGQKNAG